ncbi:MAG: hypothetical protein WA830_23145 [Candidatus Sulfotelmatobacter sp.]
MGNGALELQKLIETSFPGRGRWSHLEEMMLVEVSQRDDAFEEWDKIKRWKQSVPRALLQVEGVATVKQLLDHWTDILDKINGDYRPGRPKGKVAEDEAKMNRDTHRILDQIMKPIPQPEP